MKYKNKHSTVKAILMNYAMLMSHCSSRFYCVTLLNKLKKKISLESAGLEKLFPFL